MNVSSIIEDTPSPEVIPIPPTDWLNTHLFPRSMTMADRLASCNDPYNYPHYTYPNFDPPRDHPMFNSNGPRKSFFDNVYENGFSALNEIEIPRYNQNGSQQNHSANLFNHRSFHPTLGDNSDCDKKISELENGIIPSSFMQNAAQRPEEQIRWPNYALNTNANMKAARSLTNINEIVQHQIVQTPSAPKKWASIVSCNTAKPLTTKTPSPVKKISPSIAKNLNLTEEIEKLEDLDIYMPKTVWLLIRYGNRKSNKADIQKFVRHLCGAYGLLAEECYLYYIDIRKTDHIVLQMSTKNYDKLNGQCSSTDLRVTVNGQHHSFRRISPVIQCFTCFSFEHYNGNCTLGYRRCEICSDEFAPGHMCAGEYFCINCKNAPNRSSFNHSPKSLNCPLVFERCQLIANRIVHL